MSDTPRALVVDDDASWRELLGELLNDLGLEVDPAASLEEASGHLRARRHRLAVVDLSLGGADHRNEDGLRVLQAVRRHDPGCMAVLLTGYATVELAVSALTTYGAYTCLRKESFRRSAFRELVREALASAPAMSPFRAPASDTPSLGESGLAGPPSAGADPGHGGGEHGRAAIRNAAAPDGQPEAPHTATGGGQITSVLLVEDDAGWRSILGELLAEGGYLVRASASYAEALGHLRRERYALAVVDLGLANSLTPAGNQDGYQVLARARDAGLPTIIVSGQGTPAAADTAYAEYRAFAYLEKQAFDREEFLRTAHEATASQAEIGPGGLTRREREVLELLVRGLTNKGIANELVISTNTVKRYLKSIFAKLDVDSRAGATAKAISSGLVEGGR